METVLTIVSQKQLFEILSAAPLFTRVRHCPCNQMGTDIMLLSPPLFLSLGVYKNLADELR